MVILQNKTAEKSNVSAQPNDSVLVTLFPPDGRDRIKALLNNKNNIVFHVEKRRMAAII